MSFFGGGGGGDSRKPSPAPHVPAPADRDVVRRTMAQYKKQARATSYTHTLLGGEKTKPTQSYTSELYAGGF